MSTFIIPTASQKILTKRNIPWQSRQLSLISLITKCKKKKNEKNVLENCKILLNQKNLTIFLKNCLIFLF